MDIASFPSDFQWGVATSAFQIEGAAGEGGKGESVWDRFCRVRGAISDRTNADIACDHYHRVDEDIALMREIGVTAYRFSISWTRIFPVGQDRPEQRGIEFYERLTDKLLAAGITPFVTLNHWDMPNALVVKGGWPCRDRIDDFILYADTVTRALGDRVKHWATHNEPWCMAVLGYWHGVHAPGVRNPAIALSAAHHLLLSHGKAVPVIRQNSPGASVGIVLNLTEAMPRSDSEEDWSAARHHDGHFNRWFLDPLYGRGYPEDIIADYQQLGYLPPDSMPFVYDGDMQTIAEPCDYLGVNYYTRELCGTADSVAPVINPVRSDRRTEMGWEEYPEGLHSILLRLKREYEEKCIYVMENGASFSTGPDENNRIRDWQRIRYLEEHLDSLERAVVAGVPVRGYFIWSLMDNFEWQFGYRQRFGLIWVEYDSGKRILKDSAHWYRQKIALWRSCKELGSLTHPCCEGCTY